MNKEEMDLSIQEIKQKHPLMFPNGVPRCGFWVGAGWIPILQDLFDKLEKVAESWPEKQRETLQVAQVKEKFAGLRVYIDGANEEMYHLVREAEEKCSDTCEECGKPGKFRNNLSWLQTLCLDCLRSKRPDHPDLENE